MRRPPVLFQVTGSLLAIVAVAGLAIALAGCGVPAVDLITVASSSRALAPLQREDAVIRQAIADHERRHP